MKLLSSPLSVIRSWADDAYMDTTPIATERYMNSESVIDVGSELDSKLDSAKIAERLLKMY